MTVINFDKDAIIENDGEFIMAGGYYTGQFTECKLVKSRYGTKGLEFTFVSIDGQRARYLTIWTIKADGTELFGRSLMMSLMGLFNLKSVDSVFADGNIEVIPAFCRRDVGVILQKEWYINTNGDDKFKFNIINFFDAQTHKTYRETIDKREAKACTRIPPDKYPQEATKPVAQKSSANIGKYNGGGMEPGGDDDSNLPF